MLYAKAIFSSTRIARGFFLIEIKRSKVYFNLALIGQYSVQQIAIYCFKSEYLLSDILSF